MSRSMTLGPKDGLIPPLRSDDPMSAERLSVEQAFRRYHSSLMHFLRGRLGNHQDAADVAQETYARLLQSYRDLIDSATASMLIFRIAGNVANDLVRRRRARHSAEHCSIEELSLISEEPSQEQRVVAEQNLNVLYEAIATLPPKCQQVFLLNRVDRMTYPDIARHCGISVKMVEKHITKALAALRAKVGVFS